MRSIAPFCVACCLATTTAARSFAADSVAKPDAANVPPALNAPWHVGYAQADITPPRGQTLMAGFGVERYADGTLAPLRAQAVAFQDGQGHRAVLCTADVLGFSPETVDFVRHKLRQKYALDREAICLAASHTHWGPGVNYHMEFFGWRAQCLVSGLSRRHARTCGR